MAESFIGQASLEPAEGPDVRVFANIEIDDVTSPKWHGVVVNTHPAAEFASGDLEVVLGEGARRGYRSTATIRTGAVRTQLVLDGCAPFEASAPPDIGEAGDPVSDALVASVMRYYAFTEKYARFHIAHIRGELTDDVELPVEHELPSRSRTS